MEKIKLINKTKLNLTNQDYIYHSSYSLIHRKEPKINFDKIQSDGDYNFSLYDQHKIHDGYKCKTKINRLRKNTKRHHSLAKKISAITYTVRQYTVIIFRILVLLTLVIGISLAFKIPFDFLKNHSKFIKDHIIFLRKKINETDLLKIKETIIKQIQNKL